MIPLAQPSPTFTVRAPDPWWESYSRPVAAGDQVLIAGGWFEYEAPAPMAESPPVLVSLDACDGQERWWLTVPTRAAECQVGIPGLLPDGRILVAVYQSNASLTVHLLDPQGRELRVDDLGRGREVELDILSGHKFWLQPLSVSADTYLVSWTYRAVSYHLQCRDVATGDLRWEVSERLLASSGDVVLCETDTPGTDAQPFGGELVARAVPDGGERWRLPPGPTPWCSRPVRWRSLGGVVGGTCVVVDRMRRVAAMGERDEAVIERAGQLEDEVGADTLDADYQALQRDWERDHPMPGDDLVCYAVHDGRELLRHTLPGRAVSVGCSPTHICVVTAGARAAQVELIHRAQPERTSVALLAEVASVVAVDTRHALLASDNSLSCLALSEPTNPVWRLPLPSSPRTRRPFPGDRDLTDSAVAATDGRIYVRTYQRGGTLLSAFA